MNEFFFSHLIEILFWLQFPVHLYKNNRFTCIPSSKKDGWASKSRAKINFLDAEKSTQKRSDQRYSIKKTFLKILQNSQENTCVRVSFSINLEASGLQVYLKRLQHRCVPVNFTKFLRTSVLHNIKIMASHQDYGLYYLHLPIFSYTQTQLFCWKIVAAIAVILSKLGHRPPFNYLYYENIIVWRFVLI